jgi:hypothetical protein
MWDAKSVGGAHQLPMKDFEVDEKNLGVHFFGRSLHELVNEGLNNKLYRCPRTPLQAAGDLQEKSSTRVGRFDLHHL